MYPTGAVSFVERLADRFPDILRMIYSSLPFSVPELHYHVAFAVPSHAISEMKLQTVRITQVPAALAHILFILLKHTKPNRFRNDTAFWETKH